MATMDISKSICAKFQVSSFTPSYRTRKLIERPTYKCILILSENVPHFMWLKRDDPLSPSQSQRNSTLVYGFTRDLTQMISTYIMEQFQKRVSTFSQNFIQGTCCPFQSCKKCRILGSGSGEKMKMGKYFWEHLGKLRGKNDVRKK